MDKRLALIEQLVRLGFESIRGDIERFMVDTDADIKLVKEDVAVNTGKIATMEPTVRIVRRIGEVALCILAAAAIGGIIWAAIQSGSALP